MRGVDFGRFCCDDPVIADRDRTRAEGRTALRDCLVGDPVLVIPFQVEGIRALIFQLLAVVFVRREEAFAGFTASVRRFTVNQDAEILRLLWRDDGDRGFRVVSPTSRIFRSGAGLLVMPNMVLPSEDGLSED